MEERDTLALTERALELERELREIERKLSPIPADDAEAPLGSFLQQLLREVARANTAFETHQREGWERVARTLPIVDGVDLAEGLGTHLSLAVKQTQLTFWLEEARPGFLRRLGNRLRAWRGETVPRHLRFARPGGSGSAVKIVVTVTRKQDGSFALSHEGTEAVGGTSTKVPVLSDPAPGAGA
jgi:hypothetical protein